MSFTPTICDIIHILEYLSRSIAGQQDVHGEPFKTRRALPRGDSVTLDASAFARSLTADIRLEVERWNGGTGSAASTNAHTAESAVCGPARLSARHKYLLIAARHAGVTLYDSSLK